MTIPPTFEANCFHSVPFQRLSLSEDRAVETLPAMSHSPAHSAMLLGWLDSLTWQWGVPTGIPPGKEAVAAHAHCFTLSCIIKSAVHSGKTGSVVRTEAVAFEQDDADADSFNPHLSKYCNHIIWSHKTTAEYGYGKYFYQKNAEHSNAKSSPNSKHIFFPGWIQPWLTYRPVKETI